MDDSWKWILIAVIAIVLIFGAFLAFRTKARSPKQEEGAPTDDYEVTPKGGER